MLNIETGKITSAKAERGPSAPRTKKTIAELELALALATGKNRKKKTAGRPRGPKSDLQAAATRETNLAAKFSQQQQGATRSRSAMSKPLSPFEMWASSLQDPSGSVGIMNPVSFNPSPTTRAMPYHTVSSGTLVVNAGTISMIALFPGHSPPIGTQLSTNPRIYPGMDSTSVHTAYVAIGAAVQPVCTIGPFPMASSSYVGVVIPPACGFITSSSVANSVNYSRTAAVPLFFDNPGPIQSGIGDTGTGAHCRYQLVSMSISLVNTTPLANRGGNVTLVQPNSSTWIPTGTSAPVTDWSQFPTFVNLGTCGEKPTLMTWIPRTADLQYHHAVDEVNLTEAVGVVSRAVGMYLALDVGGVAQSYKYIVKQNWQIGGRLTESMAVPGNVDSALNPLGEKLVMGLNQTSPTAHAALKMAEAAMAHGPRDGDTWMDRAFSAASSVAGHPAVKEAVHRNLAYYLGGRSRVPT